jgi:DNA-binding MarR family transcriptional regulator
MELVMRLRDDLTPRQRQYLEFIEEFIRRYDRPPTHDEIREHFGLKSKGAVAQILKKLEEKGYIERVPYQSGSLRLTDKSKPSIESFSESSEQRALEGAKEAIHKASTFLEAYLLLLLSQFAAITLVRSLVVHLVVWKDGVPYLKPIVWTRRQHEKDVPQSFGFDEGYAGKAWKDKRAYLSHGNVQLDPDFAPTESLITTEIRSLLAVPVFDADKKVVAVVSLTSVFEDQFDEALKDAVQALSDCIGKFVGDYDARLGPVVDRVKLLERQLFERERD